MKTKALCNFILAAIALNMIQACEPFSRKEDRDEPGNSPPTQGPDDQKSRKDDGSAPPALTAENTVSPNSINPLDPANTIENVSAEPGTETKIAIAYGATPNDRIGTETLTRSWNRSLDAEPPVWDSDYITDSQVIGNYEAGSECSYKSISRTRYADNTGWREARQRCTLPATCQYSSGAPQPCLVTALPARDVGPFKAAIGKQTICTTRSKSTGTYASSTVTKVTTQSWQHQDALTEDHVVRQEVLTCSLRSRWQDEASINAVYAATDPCISLPSVSISAAYTKNISEIVAQQQGSGKAELKDDRSTSDFTLQGPTLSGDGVNSNIYCSYTATSNHTLSLYQNKLYCAGNAFKSYQSVSWSISDVLKATVTPKVTGLTASTSIANSQTGEMDYMTGYPSADVRTCNVALETDSPAGMWKGAITCPAPVGINYQGASPGFTLTTSAVTRFSCPMGSGDAFTQ